MAQETGTYPPLNTLKPAAESVWIVDGPTLRFGVAGLQMPFPTRMTIIRLKTGGLFIHSPTQPDERLVDQVARLGGPHFLIGPNRIHYWWIPQWRKALPEARVWLAPGIIEQSKGRVDFSAHLLAGPHGYPWDEDIATLPVEGRFMTEFVFFHRPTRTLVLTDLIENFEPDKLGWGMRLIARLGGVLDPNGSTPRDLRATFRGRRTQLRQAVELMLSWSPERVVLAHGRWFETDGEAELRRAFKWALDRR